MPRDGSNIYSQPDPNVVADTTIESAKYNNFTNDVAQDLNLPRPIVAGGTGATSAAGALLNLGAEKSKQGPVTNYDSFAFVNGSFWSEAGATAAPTAGDSYVGVYYEHNTAGYATIEARRIGGPASLYVRQKIAGVWGGAWVLQTGAATDFVARAGDTMTGGLVINMPPSTSVGLTLNNTTGGYRKYIRMGATSDMEIVNSANSAVIMTLTDSGRMDVADQLRTSSVVVAGYTGSTGTYHFGNSGTKYLQYDGTDFTLVGGTNFKSHGDVWSNIDSAAGTYYFGGFGTKYLSYDGTNFNIIGGQLVVADNILANGGQLAANLPSGSPQLRLTETTGGWSKHIRVINGGTLEVLNNAGSATIFSLTDVGNAGFLGGITTGGALSVGTATYGPTSIELGSQSTPGSAFIDFHSDGTAVDFNVRLIQSTGGNLQIQGAITEAQSGLWSIGYRTKPGLSAGYNTNYFNINHGTGQQLWIDNSNVGTFAYTSDYRTKKDVADLSSTWDAIKALRPIKYTHQDFTPPVEQEACVKRGEPFMKGDDIEQWGFIAHELQETLTESASSGVKDSPDTIQSPNPWTVIAALTKALQEAMTRIEALEAR